MPLAFAIPGVMLLLVLLVAPLVLHRETQHRQILRQIAVASDRAASEKAGADQLNIRREQARYRRLTSLLRSLILFDLGLREAYVIPPLLGFALTMAAGPVAFVALRFVASVPLSLLLAILLSLAACRGLFGLQRARYIGRLRRQLPDALQFVVSAVRAGFAVSEAMRGLTREAPEPTRSVFAQVLDEVSLGRPIQQGLLNQYFRTRVPEYAIFAVTLSVQTRTGGQLAATIQNLADTVRDRMAIVARAKALAGEGTVSAVILSILPPLTAIFLSLIHPGYLNPLIHDPRGRRLLLMACGALLSGIWMMRQMIAGVARE